MNEISVDWNGYNFHVVYEKYSNGWFIAIPNWEICIEASEPTDVFYNARKLAKRINVENASSVIAKAIKEHWESANANL